MHDLLHPQASVASDKARVRIRSDPGHRPAPQHLLAACTACKRCGASISHALTWRPSDSLSRNAPGTAGPVERLVDIAEIEAWGPWATTAPSLTASMDSGRHARPAIRP